MGKYRFTKTNSLTGAILGRTEWYSNLIMSGSDYGIGLLTRALANVSPLPLAITQLQIGQGTTPPTDADTGLEDMTVDEILIANFSRSTDEVQFEFFIPSAMLPNGTYSEIGIFTGDNIFARSIVSPAFTKSSNEDTSIEYIISFSN